MGSIIKLLNQTQIDKCLFDNAVALELTENVHFHYRRFRFEFTPEEFLFLRNIFCGLTPKEIAMIKERKYGYDEPVVYLRTAQNLPENNWWKNQYQAEKNRDGSVHCHIENLRIGLTYSDYKKLMF